MVGFVGTLVADTGDEGWMSAPYSPIFFDIGVCYCLATMMPLIAVSVRRLHDIGNSGWLFLLILVPLVGTILAIVLGCVDGTSGPNQYGPDPKNRAPDQQYPG